MPTSSQENFFGRLLGWELSSSTMIRWSLVQCAKRWKRMDTEIASVIAERPFVVDITTTIVCSFHASHLLEPVGGGPADERVHDRFPVYVSLGRMSRLAAAVLRYQHARSVQAVRASIVKPSSRCQAATFARTKARKAR